MAVHTETILLEDKVSPAAKEAAGQAKVLGAALDAVTKSLLKAAELGNIDSFQKLTQQSESLKAALGQVDAGLIKEMATAKAADAANLKAAKAKAKLASEESLAAAKTTANMAKVKVAMSMGREAVTAAIGGMKKAFTSLASGDVKGTIEGVTQAVAGIAKMLDLVVPGLGQAVSAIVQIAGGLAGVTAGLIKSGVEFALVTNDVTGEMAAMKKGFSENISEIFKGIKIGPFIGELKGLFQIFDQSKPSGKIMKDFIGGAFNKIFEILAKVTRAAKIFFLDAMILAMDLAIALFPLYKAIDKFAKSAEGSEIINAVLSALVTVAKVLGVALLVVVAAAVILWAAMMAIGVAVVVAVGALLGFMTETSLALGAWITSASTAAYDFISGLVNGITSGAIRVVGAVKGLATAAIGAVTSALKIGSPSRIMMGVGLDTAEGMAGGIEEGESAVHGASTGMADAAVKGANAPQADAAGAAKVGGAPITVYVQIDGAGKSALAITEEMVAACFGRIALQAGV